MRLLLLLLLLPAAAFAEPIEGESSVSEVVLFQDRARVTRSTSVVLPRGQQEIVVRGLPANVDLSSLRARGGGKARVVLGALDARVGHHPEIVNETVRKLEAQIEGLADADLGLQDAAALADAELRSLDAIAATATSMTSERLLEAPDPAKGLAGTLDLLATRRRAALADKRRVALERRGIARQIQALRAEADRYRSGGKQDLLVSVAVDVQGAGPFTLHLTYTSRGVSWAPTYDARIDPAAGTIGMDYGAWVTQRSGEDWDGVALTLSTAQPALGLAAPSLSPWILRKEPEYRPQRRERSKRSAGAMMDMDGAEEMAAPAPVEAYYEAEEISAAVQQSGSSVEFAVPGTVRIPGDGTRKRVPIARWTTQASATELHVVPERSPHAFLRARLTNDQAFPLLAGELQSFMTDRFVGSTQIARVKPGGELTLPFGADERVAVKRELVSKGEGKKGLFSGKRSLQWKWTIEVESLHDKPLAVVIEDRIPVTEYDKFEVKLLDDTTPWDDERSRGIVVWKRTLKPKAKETLKLEYAVAFPPDERPSGI